jgi:hypothetical protein
MATRTSKKARIDDRRDDGAAEHEEMPPTEDENENGKESEKENIALGASNAPPSKLIGVRLGGR